jgi:hypothetical protein
MAQLSRDPSRPLGGLISLFGAVFALCSTSCASSSGTGAFGTPGGSEHGGSAALPGGTGGGFAQGGTSGKSEGGSTAGNSGDAATPAAAGAAGACALVGKKCDDAGQACASAETCCSCIGFPGAPSCGSLWSCAVPKENTVDCPATPPVMRTACSTARVVCQYCGASGPSFWQCSKTSDPSAPLAWSEIAGISCNE